VIPPLHDVVKEVVATPVVKPAVAKATTAWNTGLLKAVEFVGSLVSPGQDSKNKQ
jgi:hypothetical protein